MENLLNNLFESINIVKINQPDSLMLWFPLRTFLHLEKKTAKNVKCFCSFWILHDLGQYAVEPNDVFTSAEIMFMR